MFSAAFVLSLAVAAGVAVMPGFQNGLSPADRQIRADVQKKLGGLEGKVTVNVQDGVVTLSGMVPSLWAKKRRFGERSPQDIFSRWRPTSPSRKRRTTRRSRARWGSAFAGTTATASSTTSTAGSTTAWSACRAP